MGDFLLPPVGPADFQARGSLLAKPEMQSAVVYGKVRRLGQYPLRLPAVAVGSHHLRTDGASIRSDADKQHFEPMIAAAHVIAEERRRLVHVHDEDIDIAIEHCGGAKAARSCS